MKLFKILSWKKEKGQCVFNVLTECGKTLLVNDYSDSISVNIKETEDLTLKVIEFSDDFQYHLPENERIKGKKSENEIEKCLIIGNKENINNLLFSIGWSNKEKFQVYKNPLTENLIDELNSIKWYIEESIEEFKKLKNENTL